MCSVLVNGVLDTGEVPLVSQSVVDNLVDFDVVSLGRVVEDEGSLCQNVGHSLPNFGLLVEVTDGVIGFSLNNSFEDSEVVFHQRLHLDLLAVPAVPLELLLQFQSLWNVLGPITLNLGVVLLGE